MRIYYLFLILLLAPCTAQAVVEPLFNSYKKQEAVLIVKTVSTDLVVLEDGRRIKLIGIESLGLPPRKYVKRDAQGQIIEEPTEPDITLEEQALTYAEELMDNKKVKLEYDTQARDSEGYICAYVYLPDGRMVNEEILKMGFAKLRIIPPNVKHADILRLAYQHAQQEKRGALGE